MMETYEIHHDLAQTHVLQRGQRTIIILPCESFKRFEKVRIPIPVQIKRRSLSPRTPTPGFTSLHSPSLVIPIFCV